MTSRLLATTFIAMTVACGGSNLPGEGNDSGATNGAGGSTASGTASSSASTSSTSAVTTGTGGSSGDVLQDVFNGVDQTHLEGYLKELTGVTPVTVKGSTYAITERWSPPAKEKFRAYYRQYFEGLGAVVNEVAFPVNPNDVDSDHAVDETTGHDIEAILPGASADTVVIITHYDSVGLMGKEQDNPGADDDGSGIATMMEAARIFAAHANRKYTVRFVAADYEEISDGLIGDVAYADYLQKEAASKGFKIVVVSDNDQTAWSCWDENLCIGKAPPPNSEFRMISCSGDGIADYPELTKGISDIAAKYSKVTVRGECDGSGDTDHYPFWLAKVPAYVIEEIDSENNYHYDDNGTGDDTLAHVNLEYLHNIAQVQITFQAQLIGVAH